VIDDANFDPASGNTEVVESRSGNSFDRFTDFIWCMPRLHDDPHGSCVSVGIPASPKAVLATFRS
jgi:hypothetical protein